MSSEIQLVASWNGQRLPVALAASSSVRDLKNALFTLTNVPVHRQKIMGLVRGKLPGDDVALATLVLKASHAFMLIGTVEEHGFIDPDKLPSGVLPDVVNDLEGEDVVYTKCMSTPENLVSLRKYTEKVPWLFTPCCYTWADIVKRLQTTINIINPPRSGKKLLVMDLDYTIYDCKSTANHVRELLRPGTHEFLEMKATELGLLTHPHYKITFVLDKTSMFSILSVDSKGKPFKHQVKALDIVWSKFEGLYTPQNTIHIDDLGRNFAMNPQNGLKITAWKNALVARQTDREMFPLAKYILQIACLPDLSTLEHRKWRRFEGPLPADFTPEIVSSATDFTG